MGRVLDFEYYNMDKICSRVHVDYDSQTIDVENFTDFVLDQAFGRQELTIDVIDDFFRDRVFPETRVNCRELLDLLGFQHFDAEAIARVTHGILFNDTYWVRFDNENLTYNDILRLRKEWYGID